MLTRTDVNVRGALTQRTENDLIDKAHHRSLLGERHDVLFRELVEVRAKLLESRFGNGITVVNPQRTLEIIEISDFNLNAFASQELNQVDAFNVARIGRRHAQQIAGQ
jgi:hypothetical protein